jgi:hypothetical protein
MIASTPLNLKIILFSNHSFEERLFDGRKKKSYKDYFCPYYLLSFYKKKKNFFL